MRPHARSFLPRFDRGLLRVVAGMVPSGERDDWLRTWEAELWHVHHLLRSQGSTAWSVVLDLSIGLILDAVWLRTESWRRAYSGTATLCLASLLGLCVLSTMVGVMLQETRHPLSTYLLDQFTRSLIAAPLVLFVVFATGSRRHLDESGASKTRFWMKRQVFFAAKMVHVLLLAFLVSADLCMPMHGVLPNTADLSQLLCFVLVALVSLRWALRDQELRCKQCLRSLTTPERVGRPSHNLLEWNGTELNCKEGHGLLSIPEMETSWCESSHWVDLDTGWIKAATL